MKKIKYFTHLLLLITVFTFTNCQKEEFIIEPEESSNELLFQKARFVYEEEINQNTALIKSICDIETSATKTKGNSSSRIIYNEEYDFEVNTELAKYIESVDGTFHSYTFPIIQNDEQDTMDNLVLYSIDGSDYMAQLVKYTLSEEQIEQLEDYDHIDSNLDVEIIDLEGDFSNYLQRGNPCSYSVNVKHITPAGDVWDFNEGSTCYHQGQG